MRTIFYVRAAGANAQEITASIDSIIAKFGFSEHRRRPYGLEVQTSGATLRESGAAAEALRKELKRHRNIVRETSYTEPVSNARNGCSDPWFGALDKDETGHKPVQAPGVTGKRTTPHVPRPPTPPPTPAQPDPAATGDWGAPARHGLRVIAVLVRARTPLRLIYIADLAGVSKNFAEKVVESAVQNGLVDSEQVTAKIVTYKITGTGRETAAGLQFPD